MQIKEAFENNFLFCKEMGKKLNTASFENYEH